MSFPFDQYDQLPAFRDDDPDVCEIVCPCGAWQRLESDNGFRDGHKFTCRLCNGQYVIMIARVSSQDES